MNAGGLVSTFRSEMSDTEDPPLWSDAQLYSFADDAQKQFCRLTEGLPESTLDAITKLSIVPNVDTYALDARILKIRAAWRADTGKPVAVLNVENMGPNGMYFDNRPAILEALITGMDTDQVRTWPLPNESVAVRLSVYRLPLNEINDSLDALEVAPQHHRHLLLWMKHLAYSVHDAETFDKTKAAEFEAAFERYCTKVKMEQERARHHTRVVVYGGIGGNTTADPYQPRSRW